MHVRHDQLFMAKVEIIHASNIKDGTAPVIFVNVTSITYGTKNKFSSFNRQTNNHDTCTMYVLNIHLHWNHCTLLRHVWTAGCTPILAICCSGQIGLVCGCPLKKDRWTAPIVGFSGLTEQHMNKERTARNPYLRFLVDIGQTIRLALVYIIPGSFRKCRKRKWRAQAIVIILSCQAYVADAVSNKHQLVGETEPQSQLVSNAKVAHDLWRQTLRSQESFPVVSMGGIAKGPNSVFNGTLRRESMSPRVVLVWFPLQATQKKGGPTSTKGATPKCQHPELRGLSTGGLPPRSTDAGRDNERTSSRAALRVLCQCLQNCHVC